MQNRNSIRRALAGATAAIALTLGVLAGPSLVSDLGAAHAQTLPGASQAKATSCKSGYYRNSNGRCVHVPDGNSGGATFRCKDGTYSHAQHRQGACSRHGGIAGPANSGDGNGSLGALFGSS